MIKKSLKIILIVLVCVLIFFAGFYFCQKTNFYKWTKNIEIQKSVNKDNAMNLLVDFGDKKLVYDNNMVPSGMRLLTWLASRDNLTIQTQDYGDMGILLIEINGYKNGTDDKYWQYFVNNEQPMIGIDKYIIKDGDFIELKFIKSKF